MTSAPRKLAIVVGGSGFIGRFLIRDLIASGAFDAVLNLDLRDPAKAEAGETVVRVDVRGPIAADVGPVDPEGTWIFNLAAACREPGFEYHEYFDINVKGAENVTAFAERIGIRKILFTSTMSTYGRMLRPTPETAMQYPETAYGSSKALAERIHHVWLARSQERRLIVCRPGVIFGPGDKENVPRMLKAIRKGYFVFPGSPDIVKGYGYVFGLVESMAFTRAKPDRFIVYNYAEENCLSLGGMVKTFQGALGRKTFTLRVPMPLLVSAAYAIQILAGLTGRKSPIHPVRIRKLGFPTNLKPQYLIDNGFPFKYPLDAAVRHWKQTAPEDF